jgi:ubiquinone/menaquinone biosynthesis C-methylase UbiE
MPQYRDFLRNAFPDLTLEVEDLYLLEDFQVGYLPERAPQRELAAVLWSNPSIKAFLVKKHEAIGDFLEEIMEQHGPAEDEAELEKLSSDLMWEIADQIIYNMHPEAYDRRFVREWNPECVTSIVSLDDKIVIDAGAGTGYVALNVAKVARIVYAIEPVRRLRAFIRAKATAAELQNVYVLDGFLHEIPLPDASADVLITANAMGWNLESEMEEVKRVVRSGGHAVHLSGLPDDDQAYNPVHEALTSRWGYMCSIYEETAELHSGTMRRYSKKI